MRSSSSTSSGRDARFDTSLSANASDVSRDVTRRTEPKPPWPIIGPKSYVFAATALDTKQKSYLQMFWSVRLSATPSRSMHSPYDTTQPPAPWLSSSRQSHSFFSCGRLSV